MTLAQFGLPDELINRILDATAEETGRVERKRSLLGSGSDSRGRPPTDPHADVIEAACGIGNLFPEQECYLVFGQDDKGNIVGRVTPDGQLLPEKKATAARQQLATKLGARGMLLRWTQVERDGRELWIAAFDGRSRRNYFVDVEGRPRIRSGAHTLIASPTLVTAWLSEMPIERESADAKQRYRQRLMDLGRTLDVRPLGIDVPPLPIDSPASGLHGLVDDKEVRARLGDLFLNRGRMLLTGLPGSGKTTALHQLSAVWAENEDGPLPVAVSATAIVDALSRGLPGDVAVVRAALGAVAEVDRDPMAQIIQAALRDGRAALFVDGLDEAREAAGDVVGALDELLRRSGDDVEVVVSTRDAAYAQGHTLGFADVRLSIPQDLEVTLRRLTQALSEQALVPDDERDDWVQTRLDWVDSVRDHDPGFFETPMLSVLLLGASSRHGTDELPRSRSEVLKLLVEDSATHREVPRHGRPAVVATLVDSSATQALIDGFRLIGTMVSDEPETFEATIADALASHLQRDYALPSGLARAGARDIQAFWDEAGVFVASGRHGVVRARVRLLAELAAAMTEVQRSPGELITRIPLLLGDGDHTEVAVLASGLSRHAADALITETVAKGDMQSVQLAVRALILGADPSPTTRLLLVDRLTELLGNERDRLNAGQALTQIMVPADRRGAVLHEIAANLPDSQGVVLRAAALVTWQVQGRELEDALRALLTLEPRAEPRPNIYHHDNLAGQALAAAATHLVPADPSVIPQIVNAAHRMNLSLNEVRLVEVALLRVGHRASFFSVSTKKSLTTYLAWAASGGWKTGIREWLEQIAGQAHRPVSWGELRRLKRLRSVIQTLRMDDAAPSDVKATVDAGEALEATQLICALCDVDVGQLAAEAGAFLAVSSADDFTWDVSRLFDGVALDLDHWTNVDARAEFRSRLLALLGGTTFAAQIAADALVLDPDSDSAAAMIHEALPGLRGASFLIASDVLGVLQGEDFPPVLTWSQAADPHYRIVAASQVPALVRAGTVPQTVFLALAADPDDSVRDVLKRGVASAPAADDLLRLYDQASSEAPPAQWTCLGCGSVSTMQELECARCHRHGPGVSVRGALDDTEPSGLSRDH
jgi:hypothetical protein